MLPLDKKICFSPEIYWVTEVPFGKAISNFSLKKQHPPPTCVSQKTDAGRAHQLQNQPFVSLLLLRLLQCRSLGPLPDWLSSEVGLKAGFTSPGSSVIKAMAAAAESSGPKAATARLELRSGEQSWERRFRSLVRP